MIEELHKLPGGCDSEPLSAVPDPAPHITDNLQTMTPHLLKATANKSTSPWCEPFQLMKGLFSSQQVFAALKTTIKALFSLQNGNSRPQ